EWVGPLVDRLLAACGTGCRPRAARVSEFLINDRQFLRSCECEDIALSGRRPEPVMWPAIGVPSGWSVPTLVSRRDVASWAGLEPFELDGLADLDGRARRAPPGPIRHYDYRWIVKRDGSSRRLIEVPRPR